MARILFDLACLSLFLAAVLTGSALAAGLAP